MIKSSLFTHKRLTFIDFSKPTTKYTVQCAPIQYIFLIMTYGSWVTDHVIETFCHNL